MRFLADENIPLPSVQRLRRAGHEVLSIAEDVPGVTDSQVLAKAVSEGLCVLTFDRDFGTLIYQGGMAPPQGVVYFRFVAGSPEEAAESLLLLLSSPDIELEGRLTVIERGQVRQRRLP